MKFLFCKIFILFLPFFAFAQNITYSIKGILKGTTIPAKVYMKYSQNHKTVLDSASIVNDIFEFNGTVAEPVQAFIYRSINKNSTDLNDMTDLYLENGSIDLISQDQWVSHSTISGTPANDDRLVLTALTKPSSDKYTSLLIQKEKASPEQKQSQQFQRQMDSLELSILHESAAAKISFIKSHPKSVVSLIQLSNLRYFKLPSAQLQDLFDTLSPTLRQYKQGQEFNEYLSQMKVLGEGSKSPDFTLPDPNGKLHSLNGVKGKYVLVDFWASWCVPCRQENPNLVKTLKRFGSKILLLSAFPWIAQKTEINGSPQSRLTG